MKLHPDKPDGSNDAFQHMNNQFRFIQDWHYLLFKVSAFSSICNPIYKWLKQFRVHGTSLDVANFVNITIAALKYTTIQPIKNDIKVKTNALSKLRNTSKERQKELLETQCALFVLRVRTTSFRNGQWSVDIQGLGSLQKSLETTRKKHDYAYGES